MPPQIDRATGLKSGAAIKIPVKVATTGNITLSGEQTIDGVACVTDDRVLVKDQTDATENGVWIVDTGTFNRAPDFDGANDAVKGTLIAVVSGTVNGPSFWQVTTDDPIVPGTSEIAFAIRANQLAGVSAFANTLLDDTTATAALATLGLTVSTYIKTLLNDADAATARATLGVPDAIETLENKTLAGAVNADGAAIPAPAGAIMMYGGTVAPTGWLLCDGSEVSRTTFADLFGVISTTYGAGDLSTTFNLPDMRGRSPLGVGQGNTAEGGGLGTLRALADEVGAETHTLTTPEIPAHTHTEDTVNGAAGTLAAAGSADMNIVNQASGSTGGGGAHNNMHPSLAVNFIIKH